MVVEERETTNACGCDLRSSMGLKTDATDKDSDGLLLDSSGGGGNFGEGTSADGFRIYTRRKRRKMSNSDQMEKSKFNDKTEAAGNCVPDQDAVHRSSSDAFPNGPGECSPRHCRKLVLQKMHESLDGGEDGLRECIRNALVTHPESGCTSVIKESAVGVEASCKQTQNSAKEHANVMSSRSLNESDNSTSTEFCRHAFFDILMSEKFSELCGLLVKNFGDVNVGRVFDVNAINSRMKDGAYETSPVLYHTDIQQVWKKLQQVGNEMVALADSLSDKSTTHYEQFCRKPKARKACGVLGASNCRGCGEKVDVRKCLVCGSCEDIYHVSCTELSSTEIPPKSWSCTICISKGNQSLHDNCVVCEKLKSASTSLVDRVLINENEAEDVNRISDESQTSKVCFICKSKVKNGENFRTCGHSLCIHKFYHDRCLTSKQLVVRGPCWYCPSCLCRGCLMDKDDHLIVLCDGCDQAYHMYCMLPARSSIPKGNWYCVKCNRDLTRIRKAKRAYENMQNRVKIEDGLEKAEYENVYEAGGLDLLVTAAKTISHQDAMRNMR